MNLILINGNIATGKTRVATSLLRCNPRAIVLRRQCSIGYANREIKNGTYNEFIADGCSIEVINFLKQKADNIFTINCERIK